MDVSGNIIVAFDNWRHPCDHIVAITNNPRQTYLLASETIGMPQLFWHKLFKAFNIVLCAYCPRCGDKNGSEGR